MRPNTAFFDLGAHRSTRWREWIDWFLDPEPDCRAPYLVCHNTHHPETCERRAKLEGNPFTRPMSRRMAS